MTRHKAMHEIAQVKHRRGHSHGRARDQPTSPCSVIIASDPLHDLLYNRWPDHVGHEVGERRTKLLTRFVYLAFPSEFPSVVELMRRLNSALHSGPEEAID